MLNNSSLERRYDVHLKSSQLASIEILDYEPTLKPVFEELNREWIEAYFTMEPEDEKIFADPYTAIIAPGGFIFFARYQGEIVGTCALVQEEVDTVELQKMAVTPTAQGQQVGKKLMLHAIEKARVLKAKAMVLQTNSKLTKAIQLYRKMGFVSVQGTSPYTRTDTWMRLTLDTFD